MRAAWDVLYLLFCFPLLWPCYVSQIVTWCYYAMVWHCLLMYTLWLPAYIFQNLIPAPCHDFQLVWRSGHQTTCLTFESMSNSFWFVQIGSTVLRQMWTLSPETETVNNKFSLYMPFNCSSTFQMPYKCIVNMQLTLRVYNICTLSMDYI